MPSASRSLWSSTPTIKAAPPVSLPYREWQQWARIVHQDLLTSARASKDGSAVRKLKAAKTNFISGITLTILIQTIGKPGWIRSALRESLRSPGAFFTPYMFRRLLKDGRKVFTVRRHAKPRQPVAASRTRSPKLTR